MKVMHAGFVLPLLAWAGIPREYCKPHPGSPDWPSIADWKSLNQSVSGRLWATIPPGSVCHHGWPQYDNASCATAAAQWTNTTWHALDPVSVDQNDETCLPDPRAPCSAEGYPEYVIVAHDAADVQEGVRFASRTGVRLVIKGTGHDYLGRSSGADSLSIYTHNIRGLSVNHNDERAKELGGKASVKIHAGEQMREVYKFAANERVLVMGGADPDVGIGGWISGGGHGPLTAKYGMGVDQVLEMEVVTADGCFKTVNAECEPDLFWALRGGGAGTFAVLISVTVKAYPAVNASEATFSYNTTPDSEAFWSMMAYFHSQIPRLSEAGVYGYYYGYPKAPTEANSSIAGQLFGLFIGPDLSVDEIKAVISPMEQHVRQAKWGDPVFPGSVAKDAGDFMTAWQSNPAGGAAGSVRLGSRLLGNSSLLGDFEKLKTALRTTTPSPWILLGHIVAPGPNTQHPLGKIAGGSDALLPAWRNAYTHIVLPRMWTPLNSTQMEAVTTELREVSNQALRELEPESGCYMSESDPTEPNWQKAKFGANYPRLLEIKKKHDPKGVFWCTQCVGSELWTRSGSFGIDNGIGQNKVKLCRAHSGKGRDS